MKIKLFVSLFFFFFITLSLSAEDMEMSLRSNLDRAAVGDFLVTAQNKNYTVLVVKSKEGKKLSFEEITVPMNRITKENFSWRSWIGKKAPGHTCWVMYVIDVETGQVQQTYSYTKNEWVSIPQSQSFLSTLLNLKLKRVSDSERKKVGAPPASDSFDRRPYWQPNMIVDGKKIPGVFFDAWRTRWPNDGSEVSGKVIEVYVPKESDKYPSYFPYWLQVSGIVGNAKVRIVDSGKQYSGAGE